LNAADIGISYVPKTPQYDPQPPLKTVEFLACGLPTIATDTVGNRVFIRNEYNGLLIDDTVESLSNAIVKLVTDTSLRTKFASVSRQSVRKYDWQNIVEKKLIPIYRWIISN
jgi:glycosyltransferase involved in cell wall biosynthesis